MRILVKVPSLALLVLLPFAVNAELVRCTFADGKTRTVQSEKCDSPDVKAKRAIHRGTRSVAVVWELVSGIDMIGMGSDTII